MGACFKVNAKDSRKKDKSDELTLYKTKSHKESLHRKRSSLIIDQNILVKLNNENPLKNYEKIEILGEGAFGTVDKVLHKQTKAIRAMKKINKKNATTTEAEIINEIEMLKKLDHLNLVKIYEFYNTDNDYYIITDFCKYGELFDKIKQHGPFSEKQAAYIIYQLLSAIHFCHSSNIIHRDLKPENILIDTIKEDNLYDIKVIDFGTAKMFDRNVTEKRRIGSSYYMAPEVLLKSYSEKCDMWSVGVILYILLTKYPPFNGKNDDEIYKSIKIGKYDIIGPPFEKISKQAKSLISKLLEMNVKERLSAEQALKHDWFKALKTKELLFDTAKMNIKSILSTLSTYKPKYKLQEVAIAFIVHNVDQTNEFKKVFSAFQVIDENGDGRITKNELIKGMKIYDPTIVDPEQEVNKIFATIDSDNNGFIEFEEFARVILDKKKLLSDEIMQFTFDFFDKDRSGEITLQELIDIFGKSNESELIKLVNEVDIDKNGKIEYSEFKEMMNKILK